MAQSRPTDSIRIGAIMIKIFYQNTGVDALVDQLTYPNAICPFRTLIALVIPNLT